jgi:peptidyl-prolyl cis-trans isomerase B (cyclophilin B)
VTSPRRLTIPLVIALLALTAGCGGDPTTPKADKAQCTYRTDGHKPAKPVEKPPGDPEKKAPTEVTIATDRGDVKVNLDSDKAPCAANSFLSLAKQGYYDNTPCHRLTVGGKAGLNVLQCGDPAGNGTGTPGYEYDEELIDQDPRLQPCFGQVSDTTGKEYCTYTAGTVAVANANKPGTSGAQFFLVYADTVLDASYTVLGRMSASGLKVVRSVASHGVVPGTETPAQSVTITSVK